MPARLTSSRASYSKKRMRRASLQGLWKQREGGVLGRGDAARGAPRQQRQAVAARREARAAVEHSLEMNAVQARVAVAHDDVGDGRVARAVPSLRVPFAHEGATATDEHTRLRALEAERDARRCRHLEGDRG